MHFQAQWKKQQNQQKPNTKQELRKNGQEVILLFQLEPNPKKSSCDSSPLVSDSLHYVTHSKAFT